MRDLTPCGRCRRHIPAGSSCPFCARRAAGLAVIVAASVAAVSCGPDNKPTPEVPIAPANPVDSSTVAVPGTAAPSAEPAPTASAEPAPTASAEPAPTASAAPTTTASAAPTTTASVAPHPTATATVSQPRPRPKYGIVRPPKNEPHPLYGMAAPPDDDP